MSNFGEISIEGGWLGTYAYKGILQAQPPVRFEARFSVDAAGNGTFSGTILDDSNLGEAIVNGGLAGRAVKFTKTYQAAKSRSGLIEYQGTVSEDGKQMTGTWRIAMVEGVWEARRVWQEEHAPKEISDSLAEGRSLEDALTETARR